MKAGLNWFRQVTAAVILISVLKSLVSNTHQLGTYLQN
jgi:hypothetical protein